MNTKRKVRRLAATVFVVCLVLPLAALVFLQLRGHPSFPDYMSEIVSPPTSARVTTVDEHRSHITWTLPADSVQISSASSPSPLPDDLTVLDTVDGDVEYYEVLDQDTPRQYFELTFERTGEESQSLIVANRFAPVDSIINLRDLGGYRTRDGRYVQWGRIFRSGDLSRLSTTDADRLIELGIEVVIDLRHSAEIDKAPDQIPPTMRWINLPVYSEDEEPGGFWRTLTRYRLDAHWQDFNSRFLVDEKAHVFGALLTLIAEQGEAPILVHCSVGKDRAGIASALLLLALGVPEETVVADYTLSNVDFPRILAHAQQRFDDGGVVVSLLNMNALDVSAFLLARRKTIDRVLGHIRSKYGSMQSYLSEAAGVEPEIVDALRRRFLR